MPGRPWEYVFYADYQLGEPRTADLALEMLGKHCSMVRELGRYRAAARGLKDTERGWGASHWERGLADKAKEVAGGRSARGSAA